MIFQELIDQEQPIEADPRRLLVVVDDLRWYAERIGTARWDKMPRSNKWSFDQAVWHFIKQARNKGVSALQQGLQGIIDQGKQTVGLAAEIMTLLEPSETK